MFPRLTTSRPGEPIVGRADESALMAEIDALRAEASSRLDQGARPQLGQFMTPAPVAKLMAEMLAVRDPDVRLLDPGAGTGSLTAAVVAVLCRRDVRPRSIEVTALEVEPSLVDLLRRTLELCGSLCDLRGISFSGRVLAEDFLSFAAELLLRNHSSNFNVAILNPPYCKIRSNSRERKAFRSLGLEVPNLYAGFLGGAIQLLETGGEVVAITPRSFANGTYFRAFRRFLLSEVALRRLHVFDSRELAFRDDDILQENLILHGERSRASANAVALSASAGPSSRVRKRTVPMEQVVYEHDQEQFIHLILDDETDAVARRMAALDHHLSDLGLSVSTGPVVDFRVPERLRPEPVPGTVPLIYPTHMAGGTIRWPQLSSKKPNAIAVDAAGGRLAVPTGNYVLVRRFSAKEEPRRVVAAVFQGERFDYPAVAFENHLNFFHVEGNGLPLSLARGLAAYLNSSLVDIHFRQFSGHTQVNASDLRNIPYPPRERLEKAGRLLGDQFPSQDDLDRLADELLVPNGDLTG